LETHQKSIAPIEPSEEEGKDVARSALQLVFCSEKYCTMQLGLIQKSPRSGSRGLQQKAPDLEVPNRKLQSQEIMMELRTVGEESPCVVVGGWLERYVDT